MGAIVLERAYIQWQRNPQLGLRVGQFLTPYGSGTSIMARPR
jgi:hypothetical protein